MNQCIEKYGADILSSRRFSRAYLIPHHKQHCVAQHSLRVADRACRISDWLIRRGVQVSREDVVRASLLHDIGMTEEKVYASHSWEKAYSHPRLSAEIAKTEFHANEVQQEAIRHHMLPVCIIPPAHLTGWILLAADKICSIREVIS